MSEKVRGGFDVVEAMWIPESVFGNIPTSGEWQHFGETVGFDAVRRPIYKPRTGLGRQYPKALPLIREYGELSLEVELLKKESGYEWLDCYAYVWGEDAAAATINLEKHCGSFAAGAKLDLATDEYFTLQGCKFEEVSIRGNLTDPIKLIAAIAAQKHIHGTDDYMTGTATRASFPTTDYLVMGDCDFIYNENSIVDKLQEWEFRMRREISKRGSDSSEKTLYGKFSEVGLSMEVSVVLDFDSTNELTDFMGDTKRDIVIKVPSSSGGREINLPSCKWKELRKPIREVDLLELRLVAEVLGTPTITTVS